MLHFAVHKEQALHSRPGFSIFKNAPLEISAYTAPIGQKYLQKNLFTNTDPVKITKSKIPPTEHKGFTSSIIQAIKSSATTLIDKEEEDAKNFR